MTTLARPRPAFDQTNARYWESAKAHALELPCCNDCANVYYPPNDHCPRCLSASVGWQRVSGDARLVTWNVVHQIYYEAFRDLAPYVVAVVQLAEGPRLITNLLNTPADSLRIDMPMRLDYLDVDDELTLPVFAPSKT